MSIKPFPVALRKESVDRNYNAYETINHNRVALRKESVDRNANAPPEEHQTNSSLSARRAWIEKIFLLFLQNLLH